MLRIIFSFMYSHIGFLFYQSEVIKMDLDHVEK